MRGSLAYQLGGGKMSGDRTHSHLVFLQQTLVLAKQAHARGDEPFGALLVARGEVVLTASNRVILERDPTRHAELNLVSQASRELPSNILSESALYASTEPCAMCAGAICRGRIPRVIYGCSGQGLRDLMGGGNAVPCRQILQRPHHSIEVLGPLLEDEGLALHRELNWWAAV
jgi:tRNA(Arg) A34 adenosine deaminase TadA